MTVKELKEKLNQFPDNMDVFIGERSTSFEYGLLNEAEIQRINFMEEPNGIVLDSDDVVVLTDI